MWRRDDEGLERLRELVSKAVRTVAMASPPAPPSASPTALTESSLSILKATGGTGSSAITSIVNQAAAKGGAGGWLKWLNPIAGLASLFTGGRKEEELAAPVFSPRPAKRSVEYGLLASQGGVFVSTDRNEEGRVRAVEARRESAGTVVVQVQAIDSRSFLDHRDEIASAVKQALMESHGLGSVLSEYQE